MTLILTHISKHGIVHASDSNVTSRSGTSISVGEGQKTFEIPFLNAGLSIAGNYLVAGQRMDKWLPDFITTQSRITSLTVEQFAHNLKDQLQAQMLPSEKRGNLFHIAGYVEEGGQNHPEFWFVRNILGINQNTGEYEDFSKDFTVSEDFWSKDCPSGNLMQEFQSGAYQLYINGFASGRISYVMLQTVLDQVFKFIWNNKNWKFRPPNSLDETENFIKLYVQFINTLFESSNYEGPPIGGPIHTYKIPQPKNTLTIC